MSRASASPVVSHRFQNKARKGLYLLKQLLQGNPDGLLRVAAERLVPKLERFRNRPWADRLRILLIRLQPGLRGPGKGIEGLRRSCQLHLPSGWGLRGRQRRRLETLLARRMGQTGAAMVTCDDWIHREGGGWTWRQKPLWDGPFDQEVGIGEGPILMRTELARGVASAHPGEYGARWREALHQQAMGSGGHAHVPLPLVRSPRSATPRPPALASPSLRAQPPLVSVLIPTAGFCLPDADPATPLVMNCLRALCEKSRFRNLEVVVIDGGELGAQLIDGLAELVDSTLGPGRWRFLREESPYSYTTRINLAARAARGELLLQLNDDTELLDAAGVEALVAALAEPAAGIAGALLLYPDGRVQHAGTAIDNLAPRHVWAGCREEDLPWGTLAGHRTFHAVTAAVCLCRRSLWDKLGGLSDRFPINYGDVDFCLRAGELGERTVLAPRSRWIHYESVSRGVEVPPELAVFAATWGDRLGGAFSVDSYCSPWRHLLAPPPPGDWRRPS
jgi:hypothetical protein